MLTNREICDWWQAILQPKLISNWICFRLSMDRHDKPHQKPVKLILENTHNVEQMLIQPDNCIYNMAKIPHGYAVIFNQE